ncbi:MAG TPA: NUDIX domain-containing protein [Pyrinomonadaceae bacterium]|nr:NUDIX domain-containing protein [Pyrinomonadaceae bacterium]
MTKPQSEGAQISERPTHAGAVTFRRRDNRTLYLIVSSSSNDDWVLPKGHIELGETPEAAALRELKEEAGVKGEILDRLSLERFKKTDKEVVVQYFLVRELSSTEAGEKRSLRWEDEDVAVRLLTFEEARKALREGVAALRRVENR